MAPRVKGILVEGPEGYSRLVGKRVAAGTLVTCGTCLACVAGRPKLCRKAVYSGPDPRRLSSDPRL